MTPWDFVKEDNIAYQIATQGTVTYELQTKNEVISDAYYAQRNGYLLHNLQRTLDNQ